MSLKLITAPVVEPISLAEARLQCRIDDADTSFDAPLALWIQAARQKAEEETGSALITQTWEQTLDDFPDSEIKLLKPGILSITSVTYIDTAGATQSISSGGYVLDAATTPGWILPADGTEWPETNDVINAVRIRFTAGFGPAATDVPAPIRSWMLLTIAFLYAQAEAFDMTGKASAIPSRFVDSLLDPYRVYGL